MTGSKKQWRYLKRTQRMYKLIKCEKCGTIKTLQRHHIDRNRKNNATSNIVILCQKCHAKQHIQDGDWSWGKVPEARCEICGITFQPKRRRRAVLCGSADCRKEKGRRSAALRWGQKTGWTD